MGPLLLAATVWSTGLGAGIGGVGGRPVLELRPWAGVADGGAAMALQAPLRLDAERLEVRPEDWDERADLGRILRFARYDGGEAGGLRVGLLTDLSLGQGNLVRRYHNSTDDDRYRTGLALRWARAGWGAEGFVDQLLEAPVVAGRVFGAIGAGGLVGGLTFAADTDAPGVGFLPAYGADLELPLSDQVALLGALDRIDASLPGVHGGGRARWRRAAWRADLQLEATWLGAGYEAGLFDTAWLIERATIERGARSSAARRAELPGTPGGALQLQLAYREALRLGVHYADALAPGRAVLAGWLEVPTDVVEIAGFYQRRARPGEERVALAGLSDALAALALRYPISPRWALSGHVARVWRGEPLRPFTEGALRVEASLP